MVTVKIRLLLALCPFVFLVSGCDKAFWYDGDGKLTDHGFWEAMDRFELDLGPIDLTQEGRYLFEVDELPREDFTLGLEVDCPVSFSTCIREHPLDAVVSVYLHDEWNRGLVFTKLNLQDWTWSGSGREAMFLYRGQHPSTLFVPTRDSRFRIEIVVIEPDTSAAEFSPRLKLTGGGWKS